MMPRYFTQVLRSMLKSETHLSGFLKNVLAGISLIFRASWVTYNGFGVFSENFFLQKTLHDFYDKKDSCRQQIKLRWETHKHNCLNSRLKNRMRNRATRLARWEICTVIVLKVTVFSLQRLCGEGTAFYWPCSIARGCVCYWLNHPGPKCRDLLQSLSDLVSGRGCWSFGDYL